MKKLNKVRTARQRLVTAAALLSAMFFALPAPVSAQAPADLNAKIAALESAVKSAQSAGDNAWMLVSSALVLMMTGPGLALFYGGLVRRKNVLATMMHSFILMAVVTVIWAVVGYSLAFGGSSPYRRQFSVRPAGWRRLGAQYRLRRDHSASHLHGLSVDVRDHHAGPDFGRLRGAHEVQRHAALHGPLGADGLLPHGPHGLGQGRTSQRLLRRADPDL